MYVVTIQLSEDEQDHAVLFQTQEQATTFVDNTLLHFPGATIHMEVSDG
jgi:hypothetical protein